MTAMNTLCRVPSSEIGLIMGGYYGGKRGKNILSVVLVYYWSSGPIFRSTVIATSPRPIPPPPNGAKGSVQNLPGATYACEKFARKGSNTSRDTTKKYGQGKLNGVQNGDLQVPSSGCERKTVRLDE